MSQQKYVAMFSSDKIHRPHAYLYQVTEAKTTDIKLLNKNVEEMSHLFSSARVAQQR